MVAPVVKTAMYRCFLPILLILAGCLRPSIISGVYVGLGLLCALLPSTKSSMNAVPISVRAVLSLLLVLTVCASIGQIAYQVIKAGTTDDKYKEACNKDESIQQLLRVTGFEKFSTDNVVKSPDATRVFLPELISLISTLITVVIVLALRHSTTSSGSESNVQVVRDNAPPRVTTPWLSTALGDTLRRASNMLIIILIGAVSCIQPSILSAPYFLMFLFMLTWYAMHKSIQHESFNRMKRFIIFYSGLHFFVIFLYQIPYVSEKLIVAESLTARLLGLSTILKFKCDTWYRFSDPALGTDSWPFIVNPIAILVLFQLTIWQYSFTKYGTHRFTRLDNGDDGSSVHEELLRDEEDDETTGNNGVRLKKITSQVMDRQRISQIFKSPRSEKSVASRGLIMVVTFFFSQAYVVGLIAMMAWAMIYHSVFGLILLLAACVIWVFPNSRKAAFRAAPFILFYVELLLIAQYVCSMDIRLSVKDKISDWDAWDKWLKLVGLALSESAVQGMVMMMAKLLLALPISLMLRLARRDKKFEALNDAEKARRLANYGTFASISQMEQSSQRHENERNGAGADRPPSGLHCFLGWLSYLLVSLWLPVVCGVLIFASVWNKACFITIGYFGFFAASVLTFKTSFTVFRHTYFLILTCLTAYTSAVIIITYCYQFEDAANWVHHTLRINEQWTDAIGLEAKSTDKDIPALFIRLLPSILLYVVTMLQLKLFHNQWKELTDCVRSDTAAAVESARSSTSGTNETGGGRKKRFNQKVGTVVGDAIDIMWKIAEVHISKLVFLIIIILVCNTDLIEKSTSNTPPIEPAMKVYALYVPLLVLISLAVCLPRKAASLFSILACAYLAAVAVCKMIFQLNFFTEDAIRPFRGDNSTCSFNRNSTTFVEVPFLVWLGFSKDPHTFNMIKNIIVSMLLLVIQSIVFYRRAFSRAEAEINGAAPLPSSSRYIVFPAQPPQSLDRDFSSFCKWLVDYSFYKFGVEISIIFMAIHIWVRMDAIAVCTSVFIILIVLSPRPLIRALWPILLCYLAVIFPLQYAMHVGFPPQECIPYPWWPVDPSGQYNWGWLHSLSVLFNLSSYGTFWSGGFFITDFMALVAVASQLYVFAEESDEHPAGDNKSIYVGRDIGILPDNPHYDYIAKQRSFVDYAKIFVFQYGHWVTLLMVLIAGLGGTSLFALGYIVLSLSMLWEGNNLYLMKNHRLTIFRWKLVLAYTAVVIMLKTALQLVGCSFSLADVCAVRQLFAMKCTCRNIRINNLDPNDLDTSKVCTVDENEANIGLDTFALAFIVFQMRILGSWYFQYVITEFRSEIVLANRGAVLSNQLIEKEMKEQEEQQSKKFDDIRDRTKAIRERFNFRYEQLQKDQDRSDIVDPDTYGAEYHKKRVRLRPTSSIINEDDPLPSYDYRDNLEEAYMPAKRAGDYYMFDYDPSHDELKKDKESFVPEVDPGASDFNKLDPSQLAYAAVQKDLDIKDTLAASERAERSVEKGELEKKKMMQDVVSPKPRASSGADSSTSVVGAAGTSGSSEEEELEVDEIQNESKILYFARFGLKMFTNTLDWIAAFLNRRSREHRYVAYVLNKERTKLKEKKGESLNDVSRRLSDLHNDAKSERGLMVVHSESDIEKMEEAAINSWQKRNVLARLTNAIGYCIGAHTDTVCYVLAIVCHAMGSGVVTLPLPLMVFFWGTLSNPRPSKFFWVAMTLYTELIIVLKFIFQFSFFDWNSAAETSKGSTHEYWWPYVLGLQKKEFYPAYEVALLMALFFHRYMLRKLGLWKDANVSETFDGDFTLSERSRAGAEEGISNPAMDAFEHVEPSDDSDSQLMNTKRKHVAISMTGTGKSAHLAPAAAPKSVQFETKEKAGARPSAAPAAASSGQSNYVLQGLEGRSQWMEKGSEGTEDTQSSSSSTHTATGEATVAGGEVTTTAVAVDEVDGGEADKQRSGMTRFIYQLFYPKFRYIRDLYPSMFGLDIICFLIIVFGYSSFGDGGSGSVVNDIQSNRVPLAFVLMMIISSFMIVIDRGLYLRKAIRCKLIYQFIIVIFMHVWIFFALPAVTRVAAFRNGTAQALYIVKSIYLLVSAWQIRNGYPQLCVGNLLMHSYGLANMVFFKVFMAVPFVWELRTAIDWTWTDTSMPLFDFFNMEQFYATIYNLKCARAFEAAYPAPRGEKKGAMVKYMMGLPFVIFIVLLIWCPLLAFSLLNKVGQVLPPEQVSLTVSIEGYPPLYSIQAQGRELMEMDQLTYKTIYEKYGDWSDAPDAAFLRNTPDGQATLTKYSRAAVAFLNDYTYSDLMTIRFRPESQTAWQISDASKAAMISDLKELDVSDLKNPTLIHVKMELLRMRENKGKEPVKHSASFSVRIDEELRNRLIESVNGTEATNSRIRNSLPRFVIVPNEGEIIAADSLLKPVAIGFNATAAYSDINMRFHKNSSMWTGQLRADDSVNKIDLMVPAPEPITYPTPFTQDNLTYIEVVALVDRVFPSVLSKFVSGGIIAMYIALVLFIGKMIRGVLTNSPLNVMITEIPNPDHLLKICLDIYLVREARDFVLEQDLFAKIIFLFRSPATLIKWTRLRPKRKEE
ncbi:hypothetical protein PENTCL1PPCAC_18578 [Pristionchus entomophagus]|uniref:Piezo-type mechanosensitive ion channel component n=1 Tax=Pristionchus entomophagus TaxID=358040 RepID=A0AAV5TPM8_9BILA|nr:hypothetical protein PENTCL1PPCAC_18578 [Pristionchus entomophagus]